jgi:hypothetical protein
LDPNGCMVPQSAFRTVTRMGKMGIKKGTAVLALWREATSSQPAQWYVGKIFSVSARAVTIRFLDGDTREYEIPTQAAFKLNSGAAYKATQCGPYGTEHAKLLIALRGAKWQPKSQWVAARRDSGWFIGRVVAGETNPYSCLIVFNDGHRHWCATNTLRKIKQHGAHTLSGPHKSNFIDRIAAQESKSSAPQPLPEKTEPKAIKWPLAPSKLAEPSKPRSPRVKHLAISNSPPNTVSTSE